MTDIRSDNPLSGGCQCGAVRYAIDGPPVSLFVCHCCECRKQSASAFGISFIVRRENFRLTKGRTKRWSRRTDSGRTLNCEFCPDCGSRVWHEGPVNERTVSIKGGSLDQPVDLGPAVHIWTSRKLPGVVIPEHAQRFPEEPNEG